MTAPIDPALVCTRAHEARRHRPLPPLDDLPLTEDDPLPLDWPAPTIGGVRWAGIPELAESVAGTLIITIGVGWVGGHAIALVLLNRAVLSVMGLAP